MERRYSKALTIILVIIILAIVGLLAYLGINYYTNYRIKKDSEESVDAFIEKVAVETPTEDVTGNTTPIDISTDPTNTSIETNNGTSQNGGGSQPAKVRMYKGFVMIGTIEIPKTGLKYNVLQKVTKKSLETSVAVVYPENAELNKPGNVVIVGHNYRNGLFFSDNKKLSNGDSIYITDLTGKRIKYIIYKVFEASENDTAFYNRNTKGKREITLSTCTDNTKARLIIQAREE